jgi:hypothetical protein
VWVVASPLMGMRDLPRGWDGGSVPHEESVAG